MRALRGEASSKNPSPHPAEIAQQIRKGASCEHTCFAGAARAIAHKEQGQGDVVSKIKL
jgi:hypothetical protein